ncbi:hypothetical protein DN402_00785 [Streptomyces sp. SW4]|nr:hypothetical protein DN402_00785 [Streptomyces sp. SW4]
MRTWLAPVLPALSALDGQHTAAASLLHDRLHAAPADTAPGASPARPADSTTGHDRDTQSDEFGSPESAPPGETHPALPREATSDRMTTMEGSCP